MQISLLLTRDETVGTVSLQYTKLLRERSLGPSVDYGGNQRILNTLIP